MSLIIARQIENYLWVVSDTKITYLRSNNKNARLDPLDGALKAVIIDPSLCLCYADDAEIGKDAIQHVYGLRQRGASIEAVHSYLAMQSKSHPRSSSEFLVITGLPNPEIRKIIHGQIGPPGPAEHIGDHEAFRAFQECMLKQAADTCQSDTDLPLGIRELSKLRESFENVISNNQLPSVGGFLVVTGLHRSGFEYHPACGSYSATLDPEAEQDVSGTEWKTLELVGSTSSGGYTYNICAPIEPGIGAIGIYINQARLGALFYPHKSRTVTKYRKVGSKEFVERVALDFGLMLGEPNFDQR